MSVALQGITTLLEVFDMEKSVEFYREALGFDVHQSAGDEHGLGWAWLKHGVIDLMLNSMFNPGEAPDAPNLLRMSSHRDVTLYLSCPDVKAAYEKLNSMGIEVKPPAVTPYGMRQCFLRDPDGYGICLQWPAN